ncbi:MAG: PD-(D/E)XK nuclease family protein [Acidobacteriota bacterium]
MAVQPFLPFDTPTQPADQAAPPEQKPKRSAAAARRAKDGAVAAPGDSRLIVELKRVAAEHPLDEKVLLSPSLLVGHQTVERLARAGGLVLNLRVETIRTLAHAVAGASIAREGAKLLSRAQALALIEQSCSEILDDASYFGALRDRPGFHRAIQNAFDELRAAGLAPGSLPAGAFADPRKPRELRRILESYEAALKRGEWIDRAGVLRRATELVEAASPRDHAVLYLLPESLELSPAERRFLEGAGGERILGVPADAASEWSERATGARIFRAAGEENEVRAVFREILAAGVPFDQAEVLHTDAATYPALAFELAAEHGVPCTFSGGVAAAFTSPGRASLAWLRWIGNGFEAEVLREALAGGVIAFPKGMSPARTGPLAAARELRRAAIGWGSERHLPALDRLAAEIQFGKRRPQDDDDTDADRARRERRLAALAAAKIFVARALSLAPPGPDARLKDVSRGARDFVKEFARVTGELDAAAAAGLTKLFQEFESLTTPASSLAQLVGRLTDAVLALHVTPERPRPGRLHFAEFRSGGFSGRPHTFVIGLDERRHPGGGREDPVLSDAERRQINALSSTALPLAPDRSVKTSQALRACVARLRGETTLGYAGWSLRDLANPGEVFPSPFLLEAFRLRANEADADYARLASAVGEGEGFVPAIDRALDETEWWLARIGDRRGPEQEAAISAIYPWLADGLEATKARRSPEFTRWDGVFASPTPELDPRSNGQPMSSSRIQALAECPFGYFLQHVLRLEAPEEPKDDRTEWLDARSAGSLIHRIFRLFLEALSAAGRRPSHPADLALIESVAEKELSDERRRIPPRSELAFVRRRDDVLFACRTFLMSEAARSGEVEPVAFEVAFGITDENRPSEHPDPVEIPLSGGRSVRLRGSIDRVDRAPDGLFHVWDYKTGTSLYIHEERGIAAGRQIQPALYALAWESFVERRGQGGKGSVAGSGYFFPGRRGLGERFAIAFSEEETRKTLDVLFDLLAAGAFAHTPDKESDCFVCRDLTGFCEDREDSGKASRAKLDRSTHPALAAWRTLHDS